MSQPIRIKCAKCPRRAPERFAIVDGFMVQVGATAFYTDLAEEMRAVMDGRSYKRPPWKEQVRFLRPCQCGNYQVLKWEKLERRVRDASDQGLTEIVF
jgi:hypothetical protein